MSELQGKWIWYELLTSDDAGSKAFYEAVVGWRITLGAMQPMNYGHIVNNDDQATGGLLPLTVEMTANGAHPTWMGYIGVDDCDAMVKAIEAKSGKLLMPAFDIPHVGRIAMVADPDGVPFYIMTPQMPAGTDGGSTAFDREKVGRCGWNELLAPTQATALDFYTSLFGWTLPEPMDMGDWGKYHFINDEDVMIGAIMQKPAQAPQGGWRFYFRVPDIDTAVATTKARGGQIFQGPMQVPGGDWVINGLDPQGIAFNLVGARPNEAS